MFDKLHAHQLFDQMPERCELDNYLKWRIKRRRIDAIDSERSNKAAKIEDDLAVVWMPKQKMSMTRDNSPATGCAEESPEIRNRPMQRELMAVAQRSDDGSEECCYCSSTASGGGEKELSRNKSSSGKPLDLIDDHAQNSRSGSPTSSSVRSSTA